jgi:hypothetical protein
MKSLAAFLLGVIATLAFLTVVFFKTTVAYQSTLFPGHRILVKSYKLVRS